MACETEETTIQTVDRADGELALPAGIPPLTSLYVYASGSCNLACRHCWITPAYLPDSDNGQHIALAHVRKAIREAKPLGLRSVKLTGGEPTLHPRFRELVTLIDEAGLNVIIETNGTLVDDDLAGFLARVSNLSFISISLDGVDAGTHEALRGVPGSYERALSGIRALVAVAFHPQIICTLHRGNVSQMADLVALAEELGCESVKFNLVQELGRGEQFAGEQGLGVAEIIELYRRVESELRPRSKVRIHFDIPFAFYPLAKLLHDPLSHCAILNILGVLAGGELSLCGIGVTVPELIYGHVERDTLREVWCRNPALAKLRECIPTQLGGVCGQCLHRDMCLGSCVANNFHAARRLDAPYQFCDRADAMGLFPTSRKKQATSSGS